MGNANAVVLTINNLSKEIKKLKGIKDNQKNKYLSDLDKLEGKYKDLEIPEYFRTQYNQLNSKGNELLKDMKTGRHIDNILNDLPVYIRYLKASLMDFEGKTNNLKHYILSFYLTSALFFALTPQFYGYILPVIFIVPIFLGVKGCKQRSINGFYMSLSVVPVALMTAVTWIRYAVTAIGNFEECVQSIVESGLNQGLAEALVYVGSIGGVILLLLAGTQLFLGIKNKDLFI